MAATEAASGADGDKTERRATGFGGPWIPRARTGISDPDRAVAEFTGAPWRLFWMMLRGVAAVVLTFGFYRFWLRTHLRRYYWQNVRINDEPLEYTGRALEMFLGFLIAIFFLAIYLFVINLGLSFYSLVQLQSYDAAIALSFLSVAPLIPFARYRAQRYLLSRTRWRSVRFGLLPGAWGYARRSILWTMATILTLGMLWPVADYHLRRFITRRTYFGDRQMALGGDAKLIFRRFLGIVYFPAVMLVVLLGWIGYREETTPGGVDPEQQALSALGVAALAFLLFLGWTWYRAFRIRYFLERTTIGDGIQLTSDLSAGRITRVVFGGYVITGVLLAIVLGVMTMVAGGLIVALSEQGLIAVPDPFAFEDGDAVSGLTQFLPFALILLGAYLVVYVVASALSEILIVRRIAAITTRSVAVEGFDQAAQTRQRPEDIARSADGFADALDVGAI